MFNGPYNVFQGCTLSSGWVAFHAPAIPLDCQNIGDVCHTDGTIYAGEFNGNKLYIAADDSPTRREWGPNPSTSTMGFCSSAAFAGGGSCDTGLLNTQILKGRPISFPAAEYCADLDAHGYNSGWYLPSRNELNVIFENLKKDEPAGIHNLRSDHYWSSTERNTNTAWAQHLGNGASVPTVGKTSGVWVRCLRN